MTTHLQKTVRWLQSIGIPCRQVLNIYAFDIEPFMDHILINQGVLYYQHKAHAGDLLHEAGHIAVAPSVVRSLLSGVVDSILNAWFDLHSLTLFDPLRGSDPRTYCGETAAIGWSYFAAQAAGVPTMLPFEQGFSNNEGREVHDTIRACIGHVIGSAYSTELFYAGFLPAKSSGTMTRWLQY